MRAHVSTTAALCLTLVVSCPTVASTQSRFDSWTTENGLPQNSIRDILQTSDGYLWLATEGGLVRFDGARFVVFDRSVPGFGGQRIGALREDRHGALWAATTVPGAESDGAECLLKKCRLSIACWPSSPEPRAFARIPTSP